MTIEQEIDRATPRSDGCLIAHHGDTGKGGYRLACIDGGKRVQLHRAIVEQCIGHALKPDKLVLHTCHEPRCIRLAHLWIGLHPYGERQPLHKLTEDEVENVHYMRRAGFLYREIGRYYGVSDTLARYIIAGKKWRHVWERLHGQRLAAA